MSEVRPYRAGGPLIPAVTDPFDLAAACGHSWMHTCLGCRRCTACSQSCACGEAESDYDTGREGPPRRI